MLKMPRNLFKKTELSSMMRSKTKLKREKTHKRF